MSISDKPKNLISAALLTAVVVTGCARSKNGQIDNKYAQDPRISQMATQANYAFPTPLPSFKAGDYEFIRATQENDTTSVNGYISTNGETEEFIGIDEVRVYTKAGYYFIDIRGIMFMVEASTDPNESYVLTGEIVGTTLADANQEQ